MITSGYAASLTGNRPWHILSLSSSPRLLAECSFSPARREDKFGRETSNALPRALSVRKFMQSSSPSNPPRLSSLPFFHLTRVSALFPPITTPRLPFAAISTRWREISRNFRVNPVSPRLSSRSRMRARAHIHSLEQTGIKAIFSVSFFFSRAAYGDFAGGFPPANSRNADRGERGSRTQRKA